MNKRNKKKYAYGQVIGAGIQLGDMIGQPIRQKSERINPYTGQLLNEDAAVNASTAGAFFDPLRTGLTTIKEGSKEEKREYWKGFGKSLLGVPFLAGKGFGEARAERLEEEAWERSHPSVMGASYNPYYMAQGGVAGEYAELEDGEPFMTPDGEIDMVNGRTHAEGGEDYFLPSGTAILGKNRSKVYGEKFKELGAKLKKAQDKHEKILDSKASPIARRSSLLMLDRIEKEYQDLVNEQEMEKLGVQEEQFAKGGIYIKPENRGKFTATKKRTGKSTEELTHSKNPLTRKRAIFAQNAAKWKHPDGGRVPYYLRPTTPVLDDRYNALFENNYNAPVQFAPVTVSPKVVTSPKASYKPMSRIDKTNTLQPLTPLAGRITPTTSAPGITRTIDYSSDIPSTGSNKFMSSLKGTAGTMAELSPILYNIGQGLFSKPEKYDYNKYVNPYIGGIRSTMRNRRYNIEPELEANRLTQAAYNRNLSQAGASPSQLYANMLAGVSGRQRADAAAYAQMQNINNQYLGQQAEMDYNLGRDVSGLKQYGYEANLRNRAAKRNYLSSGLTQLQQYAQMQKLMENQKLSDKEKINLLKDIIPNFLYNPEIGYEHKK